jgi:hypothetical protein
MIGMQHRLEWSRIRGMILETLYDRYKKICEENKMCFKNYEIYCYDSAKKKIIGDEDEHRDK